MVKAKFLALLFACICFLSCFTVYAEDAGTSETEPSEQSPLDDGCNTKEELLDFLKMDAGGNITLTGDILWDYTYNDLPIITKPAVIEMGTYKIRIPVECFMQIQGPVTFRGEGMVLFETEGVLNLSYGVEVLSTGENAMAIQCAETSGLQLFICNITASGANSTAVQSVQPVTVQLCHVSGTKAAIEAPKITLDASTAFPEPAEAVLIERVPTLDRSLRLYGITLPVDVSGEYKETVYGYEKLQYAFINPETGNTIGGPLACAWSEVPEWPAEAGSYTLTVKPINLPDWFPVEIPSFDIPLHIVDKNTLWLNVGYADPYFGILALQFAPNAPDEAAQLILFYSIDEGKSWKDVKEDFPDSTVRPDFIDVVGLEQNTNYLFYAEVTDGALTGSSNVIYHPNYISDTDVDFSHGGGDRDEDDFGDQGEQPPSGEIILPPPPDSDTDDTPDGEVDSTQDSENGGNTDSEAGSTSDNGAGSAADISSEQESDSALTTTSESETVPTETLPADIPDSTQGITGSTTPDTVPDRTTGTAAIMPSESVAEQEPAATKQQPESPDDSKTDKAEDTEISETDVTQTEAFSAQAADKADLQSQMQETSDQTVDTVLVVLALAVVAVSIWLLILWRKGAHP